MTLIIVFRDLDCIHVFGNPDILEDVLDKYRVHDLSLERTDGSSEFSVPLVNDLDSEGPSPILKGRKE